MYACPTCKALSVSFWRKWLSYPTLPAYCGACGSYSHAQRSSGGVGLVVAVVAITASGFAAVAAKASWPLILGIGSAIALYIWHWHRVGRVEEQDRVPAVGVDQLDLRANREALRDANRA